jgi:hypothetical protein
VKQVNSDNDSLISIINVWHSTLYFSYFKRQFPSPLLTAKNEQTGFSMSAGQDNCCPDQDLSGFPRSLGTIVPWTKLQVLPHQFFPVHCTQPPFSYFHVLSTLQHSMTMVTTQSYIIYLVIKIKLANLIHYLVPFSLALLLPVLLLLPLPLL